MAPDFTLDPPDAGSLTGTTTSIGDDAPHSGQQSGGGGSIGAGLGPLIIKGVAPGNTPTVGNWMFGTPLLMLFDKTGPYTGEQGRNAVTSLVTLNATTARRNFPTDRSFNAITLTLGQLTQSLTAEPRPQHEADQPAPDFPADGGALAAVVSYCTDICNPDNRPKLFAVIPERDILDADIRARRMKRAELNAAGSQDAEWWKLPLTTAEKDEIFEFIDEFVIGCMQDAEVSKYLTGFKIFDEPDLPTGRRLPLETPDVVGIVAGKIVLGETCAFRAVCTNRPTKWVWEFYYKEVPEGPEVLLIPTFDPNHHENFEPRVIFPAEARFGVAKLKVSNWVGESEQRAFEFSVLLSEVDSVPPKWTGLYFRTTEGMISGVAIERTFDYSEAPTFVVPGGPFPNGQDGVFGVCAVHQSDHVIGDFSAVTGNDFHGSLWEIHHGTGSPAILNGDRESPATTAPEAIGGVSQEVTGSIVRLAGSLELSFSLAFTLDVQPGRLDQPLSWVRPGLLQRVAERVASKFVLWTNSARPLRLQMNFNGAVIEERFRGEAGLAPTALATDSRKLLSAANLDVSDKLDNFSANSFHDRQNDIFKARFPSQSTPAACFRLKRDLPAVPVLYSIDHYPDLLSNAQLREQYPLAFGETPATEVLTWLRGNLHLRDIVRATHAYGRFVNDIRQPKVTEPQKTSLRKSIFWAQMWGFPHHPELNTWYSVAGTLPRDPEAPAPDDGWDLRKPGERTARFQAWIAIFFGAEGIGWFSQFFMADALIFLLYNPLASEILRYRDFRWKARLLSVEGAGQETFEGEPVLGYSQVTALSPRDTQGNLREQVVLGATGEEGPFGRLELPLIVALFRHNDPTGLETAKDVLFIINPSWRNRTVLLDFERFPDETGWTSTERWQLHKFGEVVSSPSGLPAGVDQNGDTVTPHLFPVDGKLQLPLLPHDVRIYERVVPA